jgi:hypothetical protein
MLLLSTFWEPSVQAATALPFFPERLVSESEIGAKSRGYPNGDGIGFRRGSVGTHTSRTIMLGELTVLFDSVPATATKEDIAVAIRHDNCLGKATTSTRRLTHQRLSELYALDPHVPIYRVLLRLWSVEPSGRPLLALLVAIARDPMLAASAPAVVLLPIGTDFARGPMKDAIRVSIGDRLSEAILDKVVRNAASSWTQSGHLAGRTIKTRQKVKATPTTVALALYLAHAAGFRGPQLFASAWTKLLDADASVIRSLAIEAKRAGLIDIRAAGDVVDASFDRLDPGLQSASTTTSEGVA